MHTHARSQALFAAAKTRMPGGVSSPVRAFKAVGGSPVFVKRGAGAWIEDVDGNRYVDYVLSYGPLLVGHAHEEVVAAVQDAAAKGTSFGACTEHESALVDKVQTVMPKIDRLRLVNSGTEAVMSALRLARAFTGRDKIIKCAGQLSWSCGLSVGAGRQRSRYSGFTEQSWGSQQYGKRHAGCAIQRSFRGGDSPGSVRRADCGDDS